MRVYVYRWDLDKTYLETDFDSLRGLMRSATEPASAKRAVPGAAALMRALSAHQGSKVYIVSGSPTQLRPVLEEKLRLDGVTFEHLALKDSLAHLKKGELRAIKGQVGYKLPTLLEGRQGLGRAVRETLFGDDAEVDALVYSIYADVLAGRIGPPELSRLMEAAGAYPARIEAALQAAGRLSTADVVDRIFIRLDRGRPPEDFAALGGRLVPIYSWWQAALVLLQDGLLDPAGAGEVLEAWLVETGQDDWAAAGLAQDLVRRGFIGAELADRVEGPEAAREAARRAIRRGSASSPPLRSPASIDYLSLLRGWNRRAKERA